jgi:hypothetical protein
LQGITNIGNTASAQASALSNGARGSAQASGGVFASSSASSRVSESVQKSAIVEEVVQKEVVIAEIVSEAATPKVQAIDVAVSRSASKAYDNDNAEVPTLNVEEVFEEPVASIAGIESSTSGSSRVCVFSALLASLLMLMLC